MPSHSEDWFEREQLHFAAAEGDVAKVADLLSRGMDPNALDELGLTPLHYAAKAECIKAVELLLSSGARVDARDEARSGDTALGSVAATCSLEMARALIRAGADPTIPGWMQISALHQSRQRKRQPGPEVCALLEKVARGR